MTSRPAPTEPAPDAVIPGSAGVPFEPHSEAVIGDGGYQFVEVFQPRWHDERVVVGARRSFAQHAEQSAQLDQ